MNRRKILITSIILLFAVLMAVLAWHNASNQKKASINNYEKCAAAGYPILDSYPEQCSVPGGRTYTRAVTNEIRESGISVEGTTVCLPHKDMNGPHTMECAMGIKTDAGKYYGISANPQDTYINETNRRVRVSGILKKEAESKYNSEGVITITAHELID